jgi:DMSO reductase anchor subunit
VLPAAYSLGSLFFWQIAEDIGHREMPEWAQRSTDLAFVLMFQAQIYIVVIGVLLLLLLKRSWRAHALAIVVVPWLMILGLGAFHVITGPQTLTLWEATQSVAAACLEVGYAYVALAFAGMLILSRTGTVVPS